MKTMRKLLPALAMLLVSCVVMSSASFAWFTMSRQVTAQGMNVTVTAPNNLMIKSIDGAGTEYAELAQYSAQNVKLVPASTLTGLTTGADKIYVVKNGESINFATGALKLAETKLEEAVAAVGNADPAQATEGGYYDFNYNVKTDNTTDDVKVVVKSIRILNTAGDAEPDAEGKIDGRSVKPVRIAVMQKTSPTSAKIFKPLAAATNLDENKVVKTIDGSELATLAAPVYTTAGTNVEGDVVFTVPKAELEAGAIKSGTGNLDITIRVWFEGQDTTCKADDAANAAFSVEVVLADITSMP